MTLDEFEKQVVSGSGLLESADAQELCQLPRKVSPGQSRLGFGCDWQTAPGETNSRATGSLVRLGQWEVLGLGGGESQGITRAGMGSTWTVA